MHITYRYPQQPAITFIVMSSFVVLAIYMPACVLCKHYAGGTCILHCALFNNYYTRLPSHQFHLHRRRNKLREKLRVSLPLFYIIVFWPFDNFPNGISWISWKGSVKQETRLTSIFPHRNQAKTKVVLTRNTVSSIRKVGNSFVSQ